MSERLKYMGQRAELELKKKSLEIQIKGLVANLRDALDPLLPIGDLRTAEIMEWSFELADARDRFSETVSSLNQIKDILGR